MINVVGIHGIGNYRYFREHGSAEAAAEAISTAWSGWLALGLGREGLADVRVAYYSQHLHRGTPQGGDDISYLPPDAQDLLISWVERLQPVPQIAEGPRTARARQAADWLTRHFGLPARMFVVAFCRELETYLAAPSSPRRLAARDAVATTIGDRRPDVVIAHSLGSVVAYETLWQHPELPVGLLITMGSPLAMPRLVLERLVPEANGRGGCPPSVRRWVNVADVGDIVAIPRGGLGQHFDGVEDAPDVVIGTWDFHTAEGYLRCADVAGFVAGAAGA